MKTDWKKLTALIKEVRKYDNTGPLEEWVADKDKRIAGLEAKNTGLETDLYIAKHGHQEMDKRLAISCREADKAEAERDELRKFVRNLYPDVIHMPDCDVLHESTGIVCTCGGQTRIDVLLSEEGAGK